MKHRNILVGALLIPCTALAQTPGGEKVDSIIEEDLSLVGVVDAAAFELSDDDGESGQQDVSTSVLTSHDVFLNTASYQLSPMRFRVRGYENIYEQRYINGIPFNDQYRGVFNYSSIGALNDLTRNGDEAINSQPGVFAFGSIGGAENIFMRAGDYARGGKATLSYTNRNYYLRGMLSYSTGFNDNGWAFTALVGGRYSNEGNVDGTFYRNFSYALMAEKQWDGGRHRLALTTFGSPVQRGQSGGTLQEVYDLTGNNLYNPNWGYQNGKKRNARVVTAYDPTGILSYEWKIKPEVKLNAGVTFHYGRYGNTALNWYDGADPRPDYYRYLPSYMDNPELAAQYEEFWRSGNTAFTQIDWAALYEANLYNKRFGDGRAIYMVEERRSDLYETTFNATIDARLNHHSKLTGGITARNSISHQFKTVDDLLGADYVLDIDKFAEQDFPGDPNAAQNDLNRPNRRVTEGGIFGYDYNININSMRGWLVNNYNSRHLDGYYGFQLTYTDFYRDGNMRNGHYADDSYGHGDHHKFTDVMLKGGLTWKINGRHLISANIAYGSQAPLPYDAYVSPRICDRTAYDLKSGRIFSADLSYIFSTPKVQGRISVYQTNFYDQTERSSFYNDDRATFVNYVLSGVNRIHRGVELGATYRLDDHWSFDLAGTVSQYYYSNNPIGVSNSENGDIVDEIERVYMKGVYVGGVPQVAGTLGINYFIDYWFLGLNINGFGRNFVEAAPSRRVASLYDEVTPDDPALMDAYRTLTHQEEFDAGYTIDVSVGKIFYLGRKNSINVNLAVNNILNKKDIKTGGYEQGRARVEYPERFKSKYFYMQGINCYLNVSYRF